MATIVCSADSDGNLTPLQIQFQPGDLLQVASVIYDATASFVLGAVSTDESGHSALLTDSGGPAPVRRLPRPDPKLPPPPVDNGDVIVNHQPTPAGSDSILKIVIDQS